MNINISAVLIRLTNNKQPIKSLCATVEGVGILTERTLRVYKYFSVYDEMKKNWPADLILAIIGCVGNAEDKLLKELKDKQYGDSTVQYITEKEFSAWQEKHAFDSCDNIVF